MESDGEEEDAGTAATVIDVRNASKVSKHNKIHHDDSKDDRRSGSGIFDFRRMTAGTQTDDDQSPTVAVVQGFIIGSAEPPANPSGDPSSSSIGAQPSANPSGNPSSSSSALPKADAFHVPRVGSGPGSAAARSASISKTIEAARQAAANWCRKR